VFFRKKIKPISQIRFPLHFAHVKWNKLCTYSNFRERKWRK